MSAQYQVSLRDPRWQRRRLEVFERDGWACQSCGSGKDSLHIHHFAYRDKPWKAKDHELVTVCWACHEKAHSEEPMEWSLAVWGRWRDHCFSK